MSGRKSGCGCLLLPLVKKTTCRPSTLRAPHDREQERALASAAASLARRPHSRAELATKLRRRGFDAAPAAAALDRLSSLGLQDDADFAASFARSKWMACAWAPPRIERELVAGKGVKPADARAAVEKVFGVDGGASLRRRAAWRGEEGEEEEEDAAAARASFFDDAPASPRQLAERLLTAARARAAASRGMPKDARRRRLVGWLARRGHAWSTISAVLAELEL